MAYRKRSVKPSRPLSATVLLVFLFTLAVALALRLALELMFPPEASVAASGVPTAQVLVAPPQAAVVVNGNLAALRSVAATPVLDVAAPTSVEAPTIPARPEPTLTNTPVPLGDIGVALIPTLFPTQPGAPAPLPQPGAGSPVYVPILMYHYIRAVDPSLDPMGYNLSIAPEDFAQQMGWLHEQGYTTIAMATVQQCLRGEIACPAKPIALTFDDGYEDAYSTVLPILQRYGMRGTFYIVNSFVGQPGYMTWEQLAAMRDAGMEIGAHTVSHLNLTTLDQATIAAEISESKADIDRRLGINVTSLCYPAGFYDATVEALTQAAGYTNATTTRWDSDYSDILALPRRRVAGGTALDAFVGLVTGG